GNEVFDNNMGFFFRDASDGVAKHNVAHDNCGGFVVLNTDSPTDADNWRLVSNQVYHNDRFCPGGEDNPALSGPGIALAAATNTGAARSAIWNTRPPPDATADTISGGLVAIGTAFGVETDPIGDVVRNNSIVKNGLDVFWDGSGSVGFRRNLCD